MVGCWFTGQGKTGYCVGKKVNGGPMASLTVSVSNVHVLHYSGHLYSVDWTRDWTRDWTHRKLRSSFLKARKQEIVERHYIANSLPSTRGVPTQLSPCRQPAVVLSCKTSSTLFRCEFVHDLTTTSRNTWRSLLANSRIPSGTTILQLLELFLCMLLPSLAGTSVSAFHLPVL